MHTNDPTDKSRTTRVIKRIRNRTAIIEERTRLLALLCTSFILGGNPLKYENTTMVSYTFLKEKIEKHNDCPTGRTRETVIENATS